MNKGRNNLHNITLLSIFVPLKKEQNIKNIKFLI